MKSKLPTEDESTSRGVSPVIGVILMVAITVILAAVIAAFVLDLGQSQGANVNAGVSVDASSEDVGIQLTDSGNAEDGVEIRAEVEDSGSASGTITAEPSSGTLSSTGDSITIKAGSDDATDVTNSEEVEIAVTAVAVSGDDENVVSSNTYTIEVTVDNSP
ncbi:type IV pilin [Saliphagus sp. GCM10025334]